MSFISGAVRKAGRSVNYAATATTAAVGAVGGAAVNGLIGGATGTMAGARRGASVGSRSVPAAALTLGALGVSGLVGWPVVVAVGGGALVVRQLGRPNQAVATSAAEAPGAEAPGVAPVPAPAPKLTSVKAPRSKPTRPARTGASRGETTGRR